jgi:hypothetical protein
VSGFSSMFSQLLKLFPRTEFQDQLVLEPELPAAGDLRLTAPEQLLKHGPVELPRPMFVGSFV